MCPCLSAQVPKQTKKGVLVEVRVASLKGCESEYEGGGSEAKNSEWGKKW